MRVIKKALRDCSRLFLRFFLLFIVTNLENALLERLAVLKLSSNDFIDGHDVATFFKFHHALLCINYCLVENSLVDSGKLLLALLLDHGLEVWL